MSGTESPERLLCGCLLNGSYFDDVTSLVSIEDFVDPVSRKVFEKIGERVRAGEWVDAVTLCEAMPSSMHADVLRMGSDAYEVSSPIAARNYAKIVQRGARRRVVRRTLEEGLSRIDNGEDIDPLAEEVSLTIDQSFRNKGTTPALPALLRQSAAAIQGAYEQRRDYGFVGESFTLAELDARLGGLFGTMLVVVGARTSVGKSTYGWQLAIEAARNGSHIGIIDTEQGEVRCGIRLMAYYYGLNNTKLRIGIEDEVRSLVNRVDSNPMNDLPLHIRCQETDLYSIMGQIGRWKREHDIKFAVVDYLQKIKVPGVDNLYHARGEVTRQLQRQSQQLGIPIVLMSQLNRGVEKENRPPQLSDLRESGDIEQDADLVIALHGKLEADHLGNRDVEFHVLKAKDARTGKVPYKFTLNGPTYHIEQGLPL